MRQPFKISTIPINISGNSLTPYVKSFRSWFNFIYSFNFNCLSQKVNSSYSGDFDSGVKATVLPWYYPLFISPYAMISFSACSSPIVYLSSLGLNLWGMGEVCSWHTNTPLTVYIHFRQSPVNSLKVQSINMMWCWNTTLRLLAVCLHSDLLHCRMLFSLKAIFSCFHERTRWGWQLNMNLACTVHCISLSNMSNVCTVSYHQ